MDVLHAVLRQGVELFHLSPLDWTIAGLLVVLTFGSHTLRVVMMAGDVYLEFKCWRRDFRRRCREIGRAAEDSVPPETAPVSPAPAGANPCRSCAARLAATLQDPQTSPASSRDSVGPSPNGLARSEPAEAHRDDALDVNLR